jgi:hypothetical protein
VRNITHTKKPVKYNILKIRRPKEPYLHIILQLIMSRPPLSIFDFPNDYMTTTAIHIYIGGSAR